MTVKRDFFVNPYSTEWHESNGESYSKNPIAKNPERFAQARDILTKDRAISGFHAKLVSIKDDCIRKMSRMSEREDFETNDYLAGRLNTAMSLIEEIELIIKSGNMADKIIVDRENTKNKK